MSHPTPSVQQPVLFIPHGAGPCFFMDWEPADTWDEMKVYLSGALHTLAERPKAILLISAHWIAPYHTVTAAGSPGLIYDYYGFPQHTYHIDYPAPGDTQLAARVQSLLSEQGIMAKQDPDRGFDHGMFIPLKVMHPQADIPVVQLSLQKGLSAQGHQRVGELLQPLRREGVLIIASGMSFHNMRGYGDNRYTVPSQQFDNWLTDTLAADPAQRKARLNDWMQAPYASDCHPQGGTEHFIPVMVAAGAAGADTGRKVYSQQVLKTQLSAFQFG